MHFVIKLNKVALVIIWKQYSPFSYTALLIRSYILITVDLISSKKEQRPDGIRGFEAIFLLTKHYPENNLVELV